MRENGTINLLPRQRLCLILMVKEIESMESLLHQKLFQIIQTPFNVYDRSIQYQQTPSM